MQAQLERSFGGPELVRSVHRILLRQTKVLYCFLGRGVGVLTDFYSKSFS